MGKIRILHIITRLDRGGSSENTLLTVAGLPKDRFEVTLLSGPTVDPEKRVENFIKDQKIKFLILPYLIRQINPLADIRAFIYLNSFMRKNTFDIVHTHTSKAGILGRWAAKFAGIKIIVHTPHGHVFYGYFNRVFSYFFLLLERFTALITDRIITLTHIGKHEHIRYKIAKPEKFVVIYSGIDLKKFKNFDKSFGLNKRAVFGIESDSIVVGTVTRLDPVKGNVYFIRALPEILKTFNNLKVVIAGEGTERKQLEYLAKELGILDNVFFMGSRSDIAEIMSMFDIFVLSSLMEGMGRVLLEAQALGIPVVATKVGGIPEVVRDTLTGVLVPPRDHKSITAAITFLLNNRELLHKMSTEARNFVTEKFGTEKMIEDTGMLYEKLIKEKNILCQTAE